MCALGEEGLGGWASLKMCGLTYPSTYAAAGEDQIRHYMENRNVRLGYLVVMDARLNDFSEPLIVDAADGPDTIVEIFVDVRPWVSARKSRKKKTIPPKSVGPTGGGK